MLTPGVEPESMAYKTIMLTVTPCEQYIQYAIL